LLEQSHVEIVHRRFDRITKDAFAFERTSSTPDQYQGQIDVRVRVRVADSASMQHERMVEQVPVALGRSFQFAQETCQQLDVILVDLVPFFKLQRVVLMMRDGMMRIVDAI
jgi:hypothetical protein